MSTRTTTVTRRRGRKRYTKYKPRSHLSKLQRADVKKIIEKTTEPKFLNINATQTIAVQTPTITHLSPIAQGITDSTRIGDELRLDKMYIRAFIGANAPRNFIRVIFFQWKPDDTTAPPTSADILLVGSSGTQDYTSQYNHDKRYLYKILIDHTFTLVGNGAADTYPNQDTSIQFHQWFHKFSLTKLQYDAAAITGTNQLYIMYMGDQNGASAPYLFYTIKLLYHDG